MSSESAVSELAERPRRSARTTPAEHLAVLDRRVGFLRGRAAERHTGEFYDRAERAALEWALGVVRARLAEDAADRREGDSG
jgi:hypothetical protein